MRRMSLWSMAALMAVLLAGCGKPTHESVMKSAIDQMKTLVDVLKTVKDEASAKAAAPKIQAIAKELQELKRQADDLGKPTKEQDQALEKKYAEETKKIAMGMMQEMMRIQMNPALAAPMKEAMAELQKAK